MDNSSEGSGSPQPHFLDLLHGQTDSARRHDDWEEDSDQEASWPLLPLSIEGPPTRLKHSPRYENLSVFAEHSSQPSEAAAQHPWTPPPSPSLVRLRDVMDEFGEVSFSPRKDETAESWTRKQMLQDLDRLYELLWRPTVDGGGPIDHATGGSGCAGGER